jgi:hypothetical protein
MSSIGVVYEKNKQKAINFFLELVFLIFLSHFIADNKTHLDQDVTDLPVITSTFI